MTIPAGNLTFNIPESMQSARNVAAQQRVAKNGKTRPWAGQIKIPRTEVKVAEDGKAKWNATSAAENARVVASVTLNLRMHEGAPIASAQVSLKVA